MDKQERRFEEQDHPLKNTDHAFVRVGSHGEPVMPVSDEDRSEAKPPAQHDAQSDDPTTAQQR